MKKKKIKQIRIDIAQVFLISFLLVVSITLAQSIYSSNYNIPYSAVDSGGGNISSSNYFLEVSSEVSDNSCDDLIEMAK